VVNINNNRDKRHDIELDIYYQDHDPE